jgi:mRNA-degrading endonuclease RelE of RelBE toxin-antitoxin system
VPGFRTEALSEPERCDLIADEVRAAPAERARVLEPLRKGFGRPPLGGVALDERGARDLVDVGTTEHGTVLVLWRLLADPSPSVRALAKPLLARMVEEYYGPPAAGGEEDGAEPPPGEEGADARLASLERELSRAREQLERTRLRGDERAEKLQLQLKDARAAEAQAASEAARAREAAEQGARALQRSEEALAAARSTDAAAEAQRARSAVRELEGRLGASENRAERAEARVEALQEALVAAQRAAAAGADSQGARVAPTEPEEPEEAPASWLLPVYTREFYDSLAGWDRRLQRAAFKQAHLLAQDHRHPSLRALPLEGLPGYYRVRVATDVRLIYRRGEDQNTVEILSLIDREDLDRYVRQAKTRG